MALQEWDYKTSQVFIYVDEYWTRAHSKILEREYLPKGTYVSTIRCKDLPSKK